ncbi:MAG: hypothetical protein EU548_10305, partial [Promethearchaeota archaeon]
MRKSKRNKIHFTFGIVFMILMCFIASTNETVAQNNGITIYKSTQLDMLESASNINSKESNSSIRLPMPSPTWNVTQMHLNFSNIRLDQEINVIEDNTT